MQNLSRNDTQQLLEELTDEKARVLTLAMVYLGTLFIVGIPGNLLVVYFYWHKTPNRTTNYMFICALAAYDLISCTISIPVEMFEVRYYYMFTNVIACKLLTCITYFSIYSSNMTLVLVSVDRFRQICRPFKWQLSLKQAKVACIGCAVAAFFIACPAFVFYNTVQIPVPNNYGIELSGTNCMPQKDATTTLFNTMYKCLHFFTVVSFTLTLLVLYSIIGHTLFQYSKSRRQHTTGSTEDCACESNNSNGKAIQGTNTNGVMNISAISATVEDTGERRGSPIDSNTNETRINQPTPNANRILKKQMSMGSLSARAAAARYERTVRITRLMVAITAMFLVSLTPHNGLIIWRSFIGEYEPTALSNNERVAFHIGLRTYFINCALNPFIYGFNNHQFRAFLYQVACSCWRRAR